MNQQRSPHDDSADALRSMAEGGGPQEPDEPSEESQAFEILKEPDSAALEGVGDADALGGLAELEDAPALPPDLMGGAPAASPSAADRKAREARARQAQAHQFRKFMIPLLTVVGLILLALAGLVVAFVPTEEGSMRASLHWVVMAAFPMGALLLFGAWYFHREVKR